MTYRQFGEVLGLSFLTSYFLFAFIDHSSSISTKSVGCFLTADEDFSVLLRAMEGERHFIVMNAHHNHKFKQCLSSEILFL